MHATAMMRFHLITIYLQFIYSLYVFFLFTLTFLFIWNVLQFSLHNVALDVATFQMTAKSKCDIKKITGNSETFYKLKFKLQISTLDKIA